MDKGDIISISEAARIAKTSRHGIYLGIERKELTPVPMRPMLSRQQVLEWAGREKSKGGRPRKPVEPEPSKRPRGRPRKQKESEE